SSEKRQRSLPKPCTKHKPLCLKAVIWSNSNAPRRLDHAAGPSPPGFRPVLTLRRGAAMTIQTLTLNIPEPLYQRLKERAQRSNRPVEEETLDVLASVVPATDQLPAEFADAISQLTLL